MHQTVTPTNWSPEAFENCVKLRKEYKMYISPYPSQLENPNLEVKTGTISTAESINHGKDTTL
ncbi:hypothetical protein NQ315_006315 [Exocentrus adspersus]|uniref:Uncharacterized protein n=1 Tax=Exocentrus adspersus TaxID=1586481 RepID=A0AAV8VZN7_9CUCU|nr:hypothetical protein NQ315_006315 [Exocentrus adspersus]